MAITPEQFSGTKLSNWGYTAQPADRTADVAQIVLNEHVDLRTFEGAITEPRPLSSINDRLVGTAGDADPATLDETLLGDLDTLIVVPGEVWNITSTTGLRQIWTNNGASASNYLYVGPLPNRNNWTGAKMLTNGSAPLRVMIESPMPSNMASPIDISLMDCLALTMPDITPPSVNLTTSYVQITSQTDGSFGAGAIGKVFFSREAANGLDFFAEEMRLPVSEFANDASIDLTVVTGVRVYIETVGVPANNSSLTIMAIRTIKNSWQYKTLDINTKTRRYVQAVSPRGVAPIATETFYPLVRTDTPADPTPTDAALLMFFDAGLLTTSGASFNQIDLIFREVHDTPTSGSWVTARIEFNATTTRVSYFAQQIALATSTRSGLVTYTSGTTDGPPVLNPGSSNSPADGWYLFKAEVQNSTITAYIYATDASGEVGTTPIWSNAIQAVSDSANFPPTQGRVGWFAHFADYDVQLDTWQAAATSFSSFTTKVFSSHTPVDGAQLVATFSGDDNLFSIFTGTDTAQDSNTSLSGVSWRASVTQETNTVQIDDWRHTYLDFDIFTPNTQTTDSQPVVYVQQIVSGPATPLVPLLSSSTQAGAVLPRVLVQDFAYDQWTHVTIPLTQVANLITGNYHFVLAPLPGAETTTWWIDNMAIGRQRIQWEIKARSDVATWRPFGSLVNDPNAAVHFPHDERGLELQLQCRALTEDAWVSYYALKPHYAELGKPVYYIGRVTDG